VTSSDYKLLEQMNHVTTEKYKAMTDQATDLVLFMEELQKKCTIRRNAACTARTSAELTLRGDRHTTEQMCRSNPTSSRSTRSRRALMSWRGR
jgi:hypothetical protein